MSTLRDSSIDLHCVQKVGAMFVHVNWPMHGNKHSVVFFEIVICTIIHLLPFSSKFTPHMCHVIRHLFFTVSMMERALEGHCKGGALLLFPTVTYGGDEWTQLCQRANI